MIFYITVLRALAAMLITNAHYIGIYPTDLIANGGLLGDVIFFAVSGFCLVDIKQSFPQWYSKRIIRIYPVVWIITSVYIVLGFYTFDDWTLAEYFLYPTYYHFVASIIILYIPYYFIVRSKILSKNILNIMIGLFGIQLVLYIFWYDKSTYHIDTVREPMIRFLFFQAMLLGAYFRINKEKFLNKNKLLNWFFAFIVLIIYFITKLSFVKVEALSSYQIINQIVLFILLYFVMRSFSGIDNKLEKLPNKIKILIRFIANITLEIYVVQYVIIPRLSFIIFPLNWITITLTIVLCAYILHKISNKVISVIDMKKTKLLSHKKSGGLSV